MLDGWAYKRPYATSAERRRALAPFLTHYNNLCRRRHKVFYADVRVMPRWGRDRRLGLTIGA